MLLTGKQDLHTVAFWKKIVYSHFSKPSYMLPNMRFSFRSQSKNKRALSKSLDALFKILQSIM